MNIVFIKLKLTSFIIELYCEVKLLINRSENTSKLSLLKSEVILSEERTDNENREKLQATIQPIINHRKVDLPIRDEPIVEQPIRDEHIVDQPIRDEHIVDQPIRNGTEVVRPSGDNLPTQVADENDGIDPVMLRYMEMVQMRHSTDPVQQEVRREDLNVGGTEKSNGLDSEHISIEAMTSCDSENG